MHTYFFQILLSFSFSRLKMKLLQNGKQNILKTFGTLIRCCLKGKVLSENEKEYLRKMFPFLNRKTRLVLTLLLSILSPARLKYIAVT